MVFSAENRYRSGKPLAAPPRPAVYFANRNTRYAFAIFQETLFDGVVPTWREETGLPVIYATEREAQIEIAQMLIEQLKQFITGERDFADALTTGDFILPVEVWPDGPIQTDSGQQFGAQESE